jgi:hypothetical protein
MSAHPDLPALHLLNTVFAGVTGQDLYFAEQLKAGIDQALADAGPALGAAGFAAAVQELQRRLGCDDDNDNACGFAHWDAAQSPAAPDSLWSRQQVVDLLKRIAPYGEATLLITNLRSAFCPPGCRWTRRRLSAYSEALDYLLELAASRARRHANLRVMVM